jgi:D-alanyl-D-alanine carboxypeptidase
MASLPIAGVDGTLKNRMQGMYAEKVLRAKTGTLSGVSALAGYTKTADGEVFAFGILISHYVGSATTARGIQDKIGNLLTLFSRQSSVDVRD